MLAQKVVPGMEILGESSKAKVPFVGRIWIFSGSMHSTHQEALRILCVEKGKSSSVHFIIFP